MELIAPMLTVTDRTRRNDKLFLEQKKKFALLADVVGLETKPLYSNVQKAGSAAHSSFESDLAEGGGTAQWSKDGFGQ
jgi:hypothetical protein